MLLIHIPNSVTLGKGGKICLREGCRRENAKEADGGTFAGLIGHCSMFEDWKSLFVEESLFVGERGKWDFMREQRGSERVGRKSCFLVFVYWRRNRYYFYAKRI